MTVDLRQYVDRHVFFFGLHEPVELYLVTRLLNAGDTAIDGGANIGLYAVMMATAVGKHG